MTYQRKYDTPREAGLDQLVEVWDAIMATPGESDPENEKLILRLQEKGILPGSNGELDEDGLDRVAQILAAMELVSRARDLLWIAIGPLELRSDALEEIRERNSSYKLTEVTIHTRRLR
jgi:hypothetical protein